MKISILNIKEHIKRALIKTTFYRKFHVLLRKHPKKSAIMMLSVIFLWAVMSVVQLFYQLKKYNPEKFMDKVSAQIDSAQVKRSLYNPGIGFSDIMELYDYKKTVEEMMQDTSKLDTIKLRELKEKLLK